VCETFALWAIFASSGTFASPASTDNQIRRQIIQQSVAAYLATGHPCACPYNLTRKGSPCGARSAYGPLSIATSRKTEPRLFAAAAREAAALYS
jgi:hypothetical protein